MNPSQIAKMQAARQNRQTAQKPASITDSQATDLKRVSQHLPSALKIFQRAYNGASKSNALKAKCIECANLDKSQVAACTISGCPLWRYRPYQKKSA